MEAANNLKNQNANRNKEIETNLNKNAEHVNSPNYEAELNAATASIISLPIDTSSPLITTHADVRKLIIKILSFKIIFSSPTHQ